MAEFRRLDARLLADKVMHVSHWALVHVPPFLKTCRQSRPRPAASVCCACVDNVSWPTPSWLQRVFQFSRPAPIWS